MIQIWILSNFGFKYTWEPTYIIAINAYAE